MSVKYKVMRVRLPVWRRLYRLKLEKAVETILPGRVSFNEVIQDLLDFYEKHKEEVS